jgi:hypothetical protein
MIDQLIQIAPVVIILVLYFVRLEVRLTKICESLKYIKRELMLCRPPLDHDSR